MLRQRFLILLLLSLTLLSATACLAVYPQPDGRVCLPMFQGYVDDNLAWYVATDTSNYRFAQSNDLTFAPKLDSAWGVAAPVYLVRNPEQTAKPVFTAVPGDLDYSGLWTVVFVDWVNLAARVPLKSEAQILAAQLAGDLVLTPSDPHIVVDYPIVVLGQLGSCETGPGRYIIPHACEVDAKKKRITLPTFDVNCSDSCTKERSIVKMIIPDAGDPALATLLGANLAPGLLAIDTANEQAFWTRRGPKPAAELPIVEFCPNNVSWHNSEFEYSPVMIYTILHSNIPPYTTVATKSFLEMLLANGGLVNVQDNQRINAPILPNKAEVKVCAYAVKVYVFDWLSLLIPDGDKINLYVNGRCVLNNFTLPTVLHPKCIEVFLKQGDNIIEIQARNLGRRDHNSVGIAFSNACPGYVNFLWNTHVDLFSLGIGETATILVRTP